MRRAPFNSTEISFEPGRRAVRRNNRAHRSTSRRRKEHRPSRLREEKRPLSRRIDAARIAAAPSR